MGRSPTAPLRVVVVDDSPEVRPRLTGRIAAVDGLEVVGEAEDGHRALDVVRRTDPDAVLVDLLMPGMNGFELVSALRVGERRYGIVASADVAGDRARAELAAQGVELVLKVAAPAELGDALRRAAIAAGRSG